MKARFLYFRNSYEMLLLLGLKLFLIICFESAYGLMGQPFINGCNLGLFGDLNQENIYYCFQLKML